MKYAFAIVAAAGLASSAVAQNTTQWIFETSLDGTSWSGGTRDVIIAPAAIQRVQVRVRAVLQNPATNIIGFAGSTFQPTLTGWNAGDSRVPFTTTDGSGVANTPGNFGRIFPFSSSGMGSASASGTLTSFVDGGNTLRFAGANNVTPTSNLAWGVSSSQLTQALGGTNFVGGTDVVVFKYGVDLTGAAGNRQLVASVPLNLVNLTRMTWYTAPNGAGSLLASVTANNILGATINVVPTPASLALLGMGGLVIGRRRR